jgi:hypothetical protein
MFNRPTGVMSSTSLLNRRTGTPRTISAIVEMKQYMVTFFDDAGDEHTDVLIRLGDTLYASPQGEAWCNKLGPAVGWISKEVIHRIDLKEKRSTPAAIPQQDAVNVMGSLIASETSKLTEKL